MSSSCLVSVVQTLEAAYRRHPTAVCVAGAAKIAAEASLFCAQSTCAHGALHEHLQSQFDTFVTDPPYTAAGRSP